MRQKKPPLTPAERSARKIALLEKKLARALAINASRANMVVIKGRVSAVLKADLAKLRAGIDEQKTKVAAEAREAGFQEGTKHMLAVFWNSIPSHGAGLALQCWTRNVKPDPNAIEEFYARAEATMRGVGIESLIDELAMLRARNARDIVADI